MCVWWHSVHTYAVCHSLSLCVDGVKSLVGKNCADKWVINRFGSDVFWMVDVSGSFVTFTRTRSPLAMTPPLPREAHNFRFPPRPPSFFFFSYRVCIPLLLTNTPVRRWRRWQRVGEKGNMKNSSNTILFFFLLSVCLSSATVVVVRFVGTAAGVTDQEQLEGGNGFFFLFSYSRGRRRWIWGVVSGVVRIVLFVFISIFIFPSSPCIAETDTDKGAEPSPPFSNSLGPYPTTSCDWRRWTAMSRFVHLTLKMKD